MITIKNIYKTYQMGDTQVEALKNISLRIMPSEFVAIMGASGSGKSTLMHILGLLDKPNIGEYFLCEMETTKYSDKELSFTRNKLIGFVFQQFHLLPRMSALENVELPLFYAKKENKKDFRNKAKEQIKNVGLANRISHKPNKMSGGQQQRIAIARALVNDPPIILADEPTGNLDLKSKKEILDIFKDLNQKGKTIIIVTHEEEVAAYAKRVIYMSDGEIISDKSVVNEENKFTTPISKDFKLCKRINFFEYINQAISAMLAHKLRAFLSILGILIGIASVIAMIALGQGAQKDIEQQIASLGTNLLFVRSGIPKINGKNMQRGTYTRFTFQDMKEISSLTHLIKHTSPLVYNRMQVVYKNKNCNTLVEGVGIDFAKMRSSIPDTGRFFTPEDIKTRNKVVVLGLNIVKQLFGNTNPIGETIKLNMINFKVIGILPPKGAIFHDPDDMSVLVPITTAMYRLFGQRDIVCIFAEVFNPDLIDVAKDSIKNIILKRHHINPKEIDEAINIYNVSDIKVALESSAKTMSLLLGCIATISLLVGGIGIMNIMLVTVTERTKEIGLRKAIGASKYDILLQFLIEAILVSFIGGILGIILGVGSSILITSICDWKTIISFFPIFVASAVSVVLGIVFGIFPANKASKLNPIEALRYE